MLDGTGKYFMSTTIKDTEEGPVVHTFDGPLRGIDEWGCYIFKKIPYVEPPVRFELGVPTEPWAPEIRDATSYGPGCIGAGTGVPESEDCLNLNIWVPKGGHQKMPVIVYLHGGMLQHGSGQEGWRQGEGVAASTESPTIFINFDFRLGIFGWISQPGLNISANVGLHDQQMVLRWIQRNIKAFGGDPQRVTLMGQSEGGGLVLAHMVAKGSAGLFHRGIMHSPVADMWQRDINRDRTNFIVDRVSCHRSSPELVLQCLRELPAKKLWDADWCSEAISQNILSPKWIQNGLGMTEYMLKHKIGTGGLVPTLGWHPLIDGVEIVDEPRDMVQQGRWNKAEILITVSPNETRGVIPNIGDDIILDKALAMITGAKDILPAYKKSFEGTPVKPENSRLWLLHQAVTDKVWFCDVRNVANTVIEGGGLIRLGVFNYRPRFDPAGNKRSPLCDHGNATCHAAEMFFSMPQLHGSGIPREMAKERAFAFSYRDKILNFAAGLPSVWEPWDPATEYMTLVDSEGVYPTAHYRKEQCDVLDKHTGDLMPETLKQISKSKTATPMPDRSWLD